MAISDEVLASAAPPRTLWAGTIYSIRAIFGHRELLGLLVRRELKARYKDSSLGFLWTLIRPVTQLLIYYVAVGKFLGAERSIPEFAIYIFTGLTVWALFSEAISTGTSSIVSNAGLVKKVYVPRELFPLAAMGSSIVNFAIQFGILLAAILITQPPPFITSDVWLVPMGFVALVLLGFALGLFLSAANVYLRDIKYLIDVGLLVFFWASPIVYSFDMVHRVLNGNWIEQLYLFNPVTIVMLAFQKVLWQSGTTGFAGTPGSPDLNADGIPDDAVPAVYFPPDLELRLLIIIGISLVLVWVAQRFFARLEGNFAQEL